MKFATRSLVYTASLALSLVCSNLQTIASNQTTGPFDIPLKTSNDSSTASQHRELSYLRSDKQQQQDQQLPDQKVIPLTADELKEARKLRRERINERRERAKKIIREHQPEAGQLQRMAQEDVLRVYGNAIKVDPSLENKDHQWLRNLGSNQEYLADISQDYGECVCSWL